MDISVVVATRNRCAWLDVCLEGLSRQDTVATYEVVVVDNASTDATAELITEWARRDDRVRMVREERLGHSAAKNAGLGAARGRAVLFTDDDVVVPPTWIESYASALRSSAGEGILGGAIVPVPDDLGPWPAWFDDAALGDVGMLDYGRTRPLIPEEYLWGANMGARRPVLDRVGGWDETVGRRGEERGTFEDTEYQDRARASRVPVWFSADLALQHRVPRASLTPRGVLRTTFLRAAVERRLDRRREPEVRGSRPGVRRDVLLAALRLASAMAWGVALRAMPVRAVFRRAHAATWRAGWSVEQVEDEGRAAPWRRTSAVCARRLLLAGQRVIPDRAREPGPS